jgi:Cu2+-exporting ATPase
MQQMSDRFAQSYIPLVLGGGALGFCWWYFVLGAEFSEALMISVAVLVVTCPCAAGLATPAVTSRAVNLLMKAGVVVKSGEALEALGDIGMIYIDKTGTAAEPHLVLSADISAEVLDAARALAANSRHPLTVALVAGHKIKPATGAMEHIGQGIAAPDGARLGSASFVGAADLVQDTPTLWFRESTGKMHRFPFQEVARDDLDSFLKDSKALDVPVTLISGDAAPAVRRFAEMSHIEEWIAEQDPEDKLAKIQQAQKDGISALMVGDGVNDSAALSAAAVSASFAGATQIAQMAADIVLTQPKLSRLPKAIVLSRQARRLIFQNLSFATIYNFVTVPLALAGMLTPFIAALLMSSSSVIVLANGLRLKGIK